VDAKASAWRPRVGDWCVRVTPLSPAEWDKKVKKLAEASAERRQELLEKWQQITEAVDDGTDVYREEQPKELSRSIRKDRSSGGKKSLLKMDKEKIAEILAIPEVLKDEERHPYDYVNPNRPMMISDIETKLIPNKGKTTRVTLSVLNYTVQFELGYFLEHFEHCENGDELHARLLHAEALRLRDVESALHEVDRDARNLALNADTAVAPLLAAPGEQAPLQNTSDMAITTLNASEQSLRTVKDCLAVIAVRSHDLQAQLDKRIERLTLITKERTTGLKGITNFVNSKLETLQEGIYSLNLYLGSEEGVVCLRKGKPAEETEPIVIRRKLLFMDEEVAATLSLKAIEAGGLGWENLSDFDAWVADPKHTDQILPELRGVVALRVRRESKNYSENVFENAAMNKQNFMTYLLIRNGERLYRIWTNFTVDGCLFQTEQDFQAAEKTLQEAVERYNRPLRSGEWESDREEVVARARAAIKDLTTKGLRVRLILQGLIERTKVFDPLAAPTIRALQDMELFRLLDDDGLVLSDGRPSFLEWIQSVNSNMRVGARVAGNLTHGDHVRGMGRYVCEEAKPDPDGIYVLEKPCKGGYAFFYTSKEKIYKRYEGYVDRQKRASYFVSPEDTDVLCIDFATPEDIDYYINNRRARQDYLNVIPTLKHASAALKAERAAEAPFREFLEQHLLKTLAGFDGNPGSSDPAIAKIIRDQLPKIIQDWKHANKMHRSLSLATYQDAASKEKAEALAFRAITRSVEVAVKAQKSGEDPVFVAEVIRQGILYAGFDPIRNEYVFLVKHTRAHGDIDPVMVTLRRMSPGGKLKKEMLSTVPADVKGWRKIHAAPEFETYPVAPPRSLLVTDATREKMVAAALNLRIEHSTYSTHYSYENKKGIPKKLGFRVPALKDVCNVLFVYSLPEDENLVAIGLAVISIADNIRHRQMLFQIAYRRYSASKNCFRTISKDTGGDHISSKFPPFIHDKYGPKNPEGHGHDYVRTPANLVTDCASGNQVLSRHVLYADRAMCQTFLDEVEAAEAFEKIDTKRTGTARAYSQVISEGIEMIWEVRGEAAMKAGQKAPEIPLDWHRIAGLAEDALEYLFQLEIYAIDSQHCNEKKAPRWDLTRVLNDALAAGWVPECSQTNWGDYEDTKKSGKRVLKLAIKEAPRIAAAWCQSRSAAAKNAWKMREMEKLLLKAGEQEAAAIKEKHGKIHVRDKVEIISKKGVTE
jgi:hypothetical protein